MTDTLLDAYRYAPPLASDFPTLVPTNSVNPTLSDTTGRGLHFNFGASAAGGNNVRCAVRSKTAGSNQDIILRIKPGIFTNNSQGAGIVLRESSSGKLVTWGIHNNGIIGFSWTNPTTANLTIGGPFVPIGGANIEWLRISLVSDDPKHFTASQNGTDWTQFFSDVSQTAFFTFNQVGVYVLGTSGTNIPNADIMYFKDAGIVPTF